MCDSRGTLAYYDADEAFAQQQENIFHFYQDEVGKIVYLVLFDYLNVLDRSQLNAFSRQLQIIF